MEIIVIVFLIFVTLTGLTFAAVGVLELCLTNQNACGGEKQNVDVENQWMKQKLINILLVQSYLIFV